MRLTVMATHEDRHIDWALEALADARALVAALSSTSPASS